MQAELKELQKQLELTFIYITHDQEEALNMSDRIAVMKDGRIQQLGTPAEVYDRPRTSYVAQFVGEANILTGRVRSAEGEIMTLDCGGGCARALTLGKQWAAGDPVTLALRSEAVEFTADRSACGIPAVIRRKQFAGGMLRIELTLSDGTRLTASRHGIDLPLTLGQQVTVRWAAESAVPVEGEP